MTMANTQAVRLFGYPAGEFIGRAVETLVPAETRAALEEQRIRFFADPETQPLQTGLKMSGELRRDGSTFPAEITLSALPRENGMSVTAAIRDAPERVALDKERERLRAEAERERTERRAQQTQRLESLGQLAGGVAHDFNNLLDVIQGYADFTAEEIQPLAEADPALAPVLDDIEQVRVAAMQAARLTRQLLTFARHEVTRPRCSTSTRPCGTRASCCTGRWASTSSCRSARSWPCGRSRRTRVSWNRCWSTWP